jgi:bacterioferritin (cytochrome b1)
MSRTSTSTTSKEMGHAQGSDGRMTILNGRPDVPDASLTGVPDDLYAELEDVRVLARRRDGRGRSESSRSMARKTNTYKKYVL